MDRIRFLSLLDVMSLHDRSMEMAGQVPTALVRKDALESAIAQSKQVAWYTEATVAELAVHLVTHIAMAHAFVDGNKRTASYAGLQFLAQNGARDPQPSEMIEFADLLIRYIESDQQARETVFGDFVEFVARWLD